MQVKKIGTKNIDVAGQQTLAKQYRLITEKFQIDLWYSQQNEWLSLRSTTEDGNVLNYQLKEVIE